MTLAQLKQRTAADALHRATDEELQTLGRQIAAVVDGPRLPIDEETRHKQAVIRICSELRRRGHR